MVGFNMNGQSPPRRKVGMLDKVYLWCLLMDPLSGDWRQQFNIQGNILCFAERMVAFFVPADEVGYEKIHTDLLEEFEVSLLVICLVFAVTISNKINHNTMHLEGILDPRWGIGESLEQTY